MSTKSLTIWNDYLFNCTDKYLVAPKMSCYDTSSDFFSAPGIFDFYGSNGSLWSLHIQRFLNVNTDSHIHSLFNFTNSSRSYDLFHVDLFNSAKFFSTSDIQNNFLFSTAKILAQDIESLSTIKSDVDALRDLFPEYSNILERFEFHNIEDDGSLTEALSTPDVKLYYPEPFIASPSFVHEDLWFIHVLHYQHWLWFMFISLIMFYFITFINVVRWCNMRTKPKRETRGVSRSKCADLITATVPVTWAASIIISESVDASDYYDGFGSGEIVIGIRAYQWGWEYFYPKGIDLNYNVKPSYSTMVGNSLKYTNTGSKTLQTNTLWKHYQNKTNSKLTSTPAHLLLSPSDNSKVVNFMNFNDIGSSTVKDSTAFKKIQYFSKTNPQSLFSNVSDFNLKYQKIANLYLNDTLPNNTPSYGTFRQHNYSSISSTTNSFNSLLDASSLNKFMEYNLDQPTKNITNPINYDLSTAPRENVLDTTSSTLRIQNLTDKSVDQSNYSLTKVINYPTSTSLLSAENDSKQLSNPFKYLLNNRWSKKNFLDDTNNQTYSAKFFNEDLTYRFKDLKSSNQQLLTSDRNTRLLGSLSPNKTILNFNDKGNNLNSLLHQNVTGNLGNVNATVFSSNTLDWSDSNSLYRLVNNNAAFTASHTPLLNQNSSTYPLAFDRYTKGEDDLTPAMLRSKEESAPNHIFNSYWLAYWAHSNPSNRYTNLNEIANMFDNMYMPTFTEYAEYDFRNWQALELLEDAFWESTYSSFAHDDYLNILQGLKDYTYFKKQEELFNASVRHKTFRSSTLAKPLLRDLTTTSNLNSLPIFTEDSLPNSMLLNLKNFYPFSGETSVDSIEDSYENLKYVNYVHYLTYKNLLSTNSAKIQPLSYTQVVDNFRPDYEEMSWFKDNAMSEDSIDYSESSNVNTSNDLRLSNPMKLRSTARNSIITYNAIQKVFKSRFDEGRSNARLQDFSNSFVTHPFITESKSPYESMLGKNKDSFFTVNSYKQYFTSNFNDNYSIWNSMNIYFADLPFLLSMKSDPSRYLWFDWQSRWSSIEIQPSSVARYSLLGVPYTNKSFEYTTPVGDEINDSENYLIRLARARKNYMSNWAYSPYFYSRISNWYKTSTTSTSLFGESTLQSTKVALKHSYSYWTSVGSIDYVSSQSTPSYSGVNTSARSSWRPSASIQSFYYNSSIMVDILSKREYLYRQYFLNKSNVTSLPKYLTAAPNNPLLEEVKATFPLIDPVAFSSELSRELFYQNTNFLKFMVLKDSLVSMNNLMENSSLNLSGLSNYLFFYLFGADNNSSALGKNMDLYKSQFRPMKKGVTNMIRLHATGAIAMPIEIRLHILASSKDVIHSWSIPSAGIKIDCVPGYSSHRITIFLVSGIFWGQCMEICGRFHHWMPIIVYFMKRDLFFLWCTHFMHYSSIENTFNMTDRQLVDHVRLVSYDKSTWVHEINNIL